MGRDMSGTASLKNLANLTLSRLGKRDGVWDGCGPIPANVGTFVGTALSKASINNEISGTTRSLELWDKETSALITWFWGTEPPGRAFELRRGVFIADPSLYWDYIRGDISAGPSAARGFTGALQSDLRRLEQLLGPEGRRAVPKEEWQP